MSPGSLLETTDLGTVDSLGGGATMQRSSAYLAGRLESVVAEARGRGKKQLPLNSSPFAALGKRHKGHDVAFHKNQDKF